LATVKIMFLPIDDYNILFSAVCKGSWSSNFFKHVYLPNYRVQPVFGRLPNFVIVSHRQNKNICLNLSIEWKMTTGFLLNWCQCWVWTLKWWKLCLSGHRVRESQT
jgi:hypothetical protein